MADQALARRPRPVASRENRSLPSAVGESRRRQQLAALETRANTGPHVHQLAALRETLNADSPSNRTDMAGAVYRNVVQRVGKSDMAAVMKRMEARKGEFGVGRIGLPIPPVQSQFWSRLQEIEPDPASLSVDGAAELLLSDLQLQAQRAQRQEEKKKLLREQEKESRRLEALEKLKKEQEQLSKGAPKLPGTEVKLLSFDIPLVGKGRVALYKRELTEPEHPDVLTWASHGLQASSEPRESRKGGSRTFGFLVEPGQSLERLEDEPTSYHGYVESLKEQQGNPPFLLPGQVPDLLVGPHVEPPRKQDIQPFAGVTQKSDLAILLEFEWAKDTVFPEAKSKTRYPPLQAIIDDIPGLEGYDTWLLLCCRTAPSDIEQYGRGQYPAPPSGLHPFVQPSQAPMMGGPVWRDDESTLKVTRDTYRAIEEIAEDGGLDTFDIVELQKAFRAALPIRTRRQLLNVFLSVLPSGRDLLAERLTDYILEEYVEG